MSKHTRNVYCTLFWHWEALMSNAIRINPFLFTRKHYWLTPRSTRPLPSTVFVTQDDAGPEGRAAPLNPVLCERCHCLWRSQTGARNGIVGLLPPLGLPQQEIQGPAGQLTPDSARRLHSSVRLPLEIGDVRIPRLHPAHDSSGVMGTRPHTGQ